MAQTPPAPLLPPSCLPPPIIQPIVSSRVHSVKPKVGLEATKGIAAEMSDCRVVVKLLLLQGKNDKEIFYEMRETYKNAAPSYLTIRKWGTQLKRNSEIYLRNNPPPP